VLELQPAKAMRGKQATATDPLVTAMAFLTNNRRVVDMVDLLFKV
jgi:hypothetical protein